MSTLKNKITQRLALKDPKSRRVLLSTIYNLIIRGVSSIISILLLPAYLTFFSDQIILGFWFTALSIFSWVLVFDLGIGNGLRNKLTEALANNDLKLAKQYISSSYIIFGCFVLILTVILWFISPYVDWNNLFHLSHNKVSKEQILQIVRIILVGVMLQFFLKLVNSVLYALKKPEVPAFLYLISTVLLLIYLYIAPKRDAFTNLYNLSLANIVLANLPLLLITIKLFVKELKFCRPSLKDYRNRLAKNILGLGGIFFLLQFFYLIISNTSEFFITWLTNPSYVVDYKVYYSIFGVLSSLFTLFLIPIWSEVTDAHVKNDITWIKNVYKKLYYLFALIFLGLLVLVFFMQPIVDLWLKNKAITIDYRFSIIFLFSALFSMWNSILSSFANGIGKLKVSLLYMGIGAVLNLPLTYLFVEITSSWIGVIIANIIAILPFCITQTLWLNKYFNKKTIINI